MNFFDIITLVALVWAVVRGWRSGFVSQLLGLLGIILGGIFALRYGAAVGAMFGIDARFSVVAGFLIIFVLIIILANILARLLAKVLSFVGLGWVNTLLGVLLSIVKGVIVLSLVYAAIYALNKNLYFVESQYFDKSYTFDVVREVAKPLLNYWEQAKQALLS